MQILDQGDQRSIRGERLDVPLPRSNDHLVRRLRLGTRQRVGIQLDPDRGEQDARHTDPLVSWEARVQPGSRLAEGRRRGVAVEDPGVLLQDLGEGPIGEAVAVGQAPTSNDPSALRLEGSGRLARQATLPDARGPDDRDEARTGFRHGSRVQEPDQVHLGDAADERRLAACRLGLDRLAADLVDAERTIDALDRHLTQVGEREHVTGVPVCSLPDDHAPRGRKGLEARRDVHRLTRDDPLLDRVRDHLPRVDPDPH